VKPEILVLIPIYVPSRAALFENLDAYFAGKPVLTPLT
jgi:hypothetical protein